MTEIITKRKLTERVPSYGVSFQWPEPNLVELLGHLGFDWIWLDIEHGFFTSESVNEVVRAAQVSGMDVIGRIAHTRDREALLPYLETGLAGIMMAHVTSPEDVEFVRDAIKYPPIGKRSAGWARLNRWAVGSSDGEMYDWMNEQTMVLALIEEQEGIDNLDAILAVEGLDVVMAGPGDLSMTMGLPDGGPEVDAACALIRDKVVASGKAFMAATTDGAGAAQEVADGALMVRLSSRGFFEKSFAEWLDAARGA